MQSWAIESVNRALDDTAVAVNDGDKCAILHRRKRYRAPVYPGNVKFRRFDLNQLFRRVCPRNRSPPAPLLRSFGIVPLMQSEPRRLGLLANFLPSRFGRDRSLKTARKSQQTTDAGLETFREYYPMKCWELVASRR